MVCSRSKRQRQDLNPGMFEHQNQALFVKPKTDTPALLIPRPSSLVATKNLNIPPEMKHILELGGILKQSHL